MAENYSQKKVLHDPSIISLILFAVIGAAIFFIIQNNNTRNILLQSVEKMTQLMSK